MTHFKRLTALLLTVVLLAGLLPVGASAAKQTEMTFETSFVNPLYADLVPEDVLLPHTLTNTQTYASRSYTSDIEVAAKALREGMKNRQESIIVYAFDTEATQDSFNSLVWDIFYTALEHTGEPTEGDYLNWQWGGVNIEAMYSGTDGGYNFDITYTLSYYTTAVEEQAVDSRVEELLKELNVDKKSDYEKIKAVYDYICANVTYDYDHLNDETYLYQFTAYAALIDGTAVCQGYAVLLYRLALELGVDARFISGIGNGGPHGWNIIEMEDLYYNADSTWDAGMTSYSYFLKSPTTFPDHYRDDEYDTQEFHKEYPMGSTDYVPPAPHTHNYTATVTDPTCASQGYTTYVCEVCGDTIITDYVDALAHTPGEPVRENDVKSTCAAEGGYDSVVYCSVCGQEISRTTHTVEKTEHDYQDGVCTVCLSSTVQRLAGNDRIGTALTVAAALKDALEVEKFDAIILAAAGVGQDQTKFADALSGSYLASSRKAPILLYTTGDLSAKNLAFIEENLSDNGVIYLLGGNISIPAEVEESLNAAGYTTKRLGGADRYLTNLAILNEVSIAGANEVLIAGGQGFADSLSASATGLPILLVNGSKSALTAEQIEFLKGLNGKKVTILGGNAAVSAELEAAIEEVVGTDVDRIYGETRESTSAKIADRYFSNAKLAFIAYSRMYPDGLAGGVLANVMGAPLLLTNSGMEAVANAYIQKTGIEAGCVLGGSAVITDETAKAVFGLPENAVIENAYFAG